jgi:hypothetical protein
VKNFSSSDLANPRLKDNPEFYFAIQRLLLVSEVNKEVAKTSSSRHGIDEA